MKRLRKVRQLTQREWLYLLQAWALLHLLDAALRCRLLPSLLTWCQEASSGSRRGHDPGPDPPRLAWLVETAGRFSLIHATCLTQGLVLFWFLRRNGLSASLQIGVARDQGTLGAHAWVEQEGRILLGMAGSERCTPLLTLG